MSMPRHPAETGHAGHHQARADKRRNGEKPWRNEQTQHRSEERQAAGADLHLPLQLDRLTAVGYDGQPRLLPGIETAFDDEGFASARPFSARAGTALLTVRAPLLQ